jgi:hypothetical protein
MISIKIKTIGSDVDEQHRQAGHNYLVRGCPSLHAAVR